MQSPAYPGTYASFKPFFAGYWNVSPSTKFKVDHYSNSGASAYLEKDGGLRMVPVQILNFERLFK